MPKLRQDSTNISEHTDHTCTDTHFVIITFVGISFYKHLSFLVSSTNSVVQNTGTENCTMVSKLARMWKKAVTANEIIYCHLPGVTVKDDINISQNSQSSYTYPVL